MMSRVLLNNLVTGRQPKEPTHPAPIRQIHLDGTEYGALTEARRRYAKAGRPGSGVEVQRHAHGTFARRVIVGQLAGDPEAVAVIEAQQCGVPA